MERNIPEEIRSLRQWTYSYSDTELKRPTHYHYDPDGAMTFDEAVTRAGAKRSFGLYVTKSDPYVLGDIDHLDDPRQPFSELPIALVALLQSRPTYCEVSPSGHGLRFVYKLARADMKDEVTGFVFKNLVDLGIDSQGVKRDGQVNFGQPWMRFTGDVTEFSKPVVGVVTLDDLAAVFKLRDTEKKATDLTKRQIDPASLPSFQDVLNALNSIPLDQNPRIVRAFEAVMQEAYTHYQFWVKVMMAVHNYGELANKDVECLQAVVKWSQSDKTHYQGEEDVHKHWRSFAINEDGISYKSLFGIAARYRLFWPRPKKTKEGGPFLPLITEYVNFKSLVDYYNIRLYRDETNPDIIYVSGDEDVIIDYFMMVGVKRNYEKYYGPFSKDTLIPALYRLAQDRGFIGLSHNITSQFIRTYLAETTEYINLVRLYFDTPFAKLPSAYKENGANYAVSTVEYLFECLEIDFASDSDAAKVEEERLYFAYYKSWLMGLVRNLYAKDHPHTNNCILLLTGPEQIRKTSHFRYMLPSFMREQVAFTTHGFKMETSMRDVVKLSSSNLIIVWDEIEQYLDAETESNFKRIIDNNPTKIIDKYEVIEKTIKPIAIYGGTSNQREFKLGSEGSRRMFHIPVKWVDTELVDSICWHGLINNLKKEMLMEVRKGRVPWLLTEEQLQLQRTFHARIRARTTIDIVLEELFEFYPPLELFDGSVLDGETSLQARDSKRLLTTKDVCEIMISRGHGTLAARRPAIIKSLSRLCSEYTGTQRNDIILTKPKCLIKRGVAMQGPHRKWVLPPLRENIVGSMFKPYT